MSFTFKMQRIEPINQKILSVIVTPKAEDAKLTVESLRKQTVHTEIYCVIGKPDKRKFSGQIIGETINDYFQYIDLERYDWILKSDDDILYPKDFLEVNLKANYDAIGKDIGMLVKVKPFLKFMGGKWNETDMCGSYLFWTFQIYGLKTLNDWIKPAINFEAQHFTVRRMWNNGRLHYHFGFPFLAFAEDRIKYSKSNPFMLICILGYAYTWMRKEPKDKIASKLKRHIQIKHKKLYRKEVANIEFNI